MEAGTDITMECSSSSVRDIEWFHDATEVAGFWCTARDPHYTAKSTENGCNLIALGRYNVQGLYRCYDKRYNFGEAVAIVIGKFKSSVTLLL